MPPSPDLDQRVLHTGRVWCLALLVLSVALCSFVLPDQDGRAKQDERATARTEPVRYGRDVRPILSDRCFQCHGPDGATRQADLRLDVRESAILQRDGVAAIVPGDPDASELWDRIRSTDAEVMMPPPESHRTALTEAEQAVLRAWIKQGATYEGHWSFAAPVRPTLPDANAHPVDAFLAAALNREGLEAEPPADPALALRRLFLDLTGLPPSPEEIDQHLAEREQLGADAAWSAQIETLLTTEPYRSRYAERMATPWLDQARYADTIGIHTDAGRQLWPWRDWVLRAYRDNKPFDEFIVDQLAGDLRPDATVEQKVATGFLRAHVITDEGGAIPEEYLVEYAIDRVDTTSQVLLGLTVSCARCHDHKFDPISQEDYYRLFAFFATNDEPGLYSQRPNPQRAHEPFLEVPSTDQVSTRDAIAKEVETWTKELAEPSEAEREALAAFESGLPAKVGLVWHDLVPGELQSTGGTTLSVTDAGTILASGENPDVDVHRLRFETQGQDLRLVQLDVLGHPSFAKGAPGRAGNGNAVLTGIEVTATSLADRSQTRILNWTWMWADFEQSNEDYSMQRVLRPPNKGWAIGTHTEPGDRVALLLSDAPFGYADGTELLVELRYESPYAQHVFGHVRVGVASIGDAGLAQLPVTEGRWYHSGPYTHADLVVADDNAKKGAAAKGDAPAKTKPKQKADIYTLKFAPELSAELDFQASNARGRNHSWTYQPTFVDGVVHRLSVGPNVHYMGREIYSPTDRELEIAIGSDDGFAIFVNGESVAARQIPRGAAPGQDRVTLPLRAGLNSLVFKVINTGGPGGFVYEGNPQASVLHPDVVCGLVDASFRATDDVEVLRERLAHAWRLAHSVEYRNGTTALADLAAKRVALEANIPRTMVMREMAEPRDVFLLERGQYDQPDKSRKLTPAVPAVFGTIETSTGEAKRSTRLDLARWMVDPSNPLVARVAVNRLWQMVFGTGLVSTSGDFGYQGEWPSHPELLDLLAVEFVESGWDVQHVLKLLVTSEAYQRSSAVQADVREHDPENRWLAHFPRRRMEGERIRDLALHVSGLLREEFGGAPTKPYQPAGLWAEVAMLASNTRRFERDEGDALWRRSVYSYWKRACPPPSMMIMDAPTREACVVQRSITNTPLQALLLWNDEQFLEAARLLAQRTLLESLPQDAGLTRMFRRCTGRVPDATELEAIRGTLKWALTEYADDDAAAAAWTSAGVSLLPEGIETTQLAAWTMVAHALLNLHATVTNG